MAVNPELDLMSGFREMTVEDVSSVIEIENAVYTHPWSEGIFNDCMRVGYNCWVYTEHNKLLAYGLVSVAVNEAHILNICVSPHAQGQGLGRRMLHKLMQLAAEREGNSIFLEVRESNVVAQNLYDQEGFNRIGLRKNYYPSATGIGARVETMDPMVGMKLSKKASTPNIKASSTPKRAKITPVKTPVTAEVAILVVRYLRMRWSISW